MKLTAEHLLSAYAQGYFPMAESHDSDELLWYCPERRGILPLNPFHVPRSVRKLMQKSPFTLRCDTAFPDVIRACAESRESTWINEEIIMLFSQLWQAGVAHSIEAWDNEELVGGLYGIAMGGVFFGESMFSRKPGASKLALVELTQRLEQSGYVLLDAQYTNPHLEQFGLIEIPKQDYLRKLKTALAVMPIAGAFGD